MMILPAASVIVDFHMNWSRVVLIYSVILAAWGLFLWLRGSNPSPAYLGALVIAEGIFIVQGVAGLIVLGTGHRPHDGLHYLYGAVLVLTLPGAYFFGDNAKERRDSLIFGLAGLFLIGIAIRGITTGGT
jgi:hypothetical protein